MIIFRRDLLRCSSSDVLDGVDDVLSNDTNLKKGLVVISWRPKIKKLPGVQWLEQ